MSRIRHSRPSFEGSLPCIQFEESATDREGSTSHVDYSKSEPAIQFEDVFPPDRQESVDPYDSFQRQESLDSRESICLHESLDLDPMSPPSPTAAKTSTLTFSIDKGQPAESHCKRARLKTACSESCLPRPNSTGDVASSVIHQLQNMNIAVVSSAPPKKTSRLQRILAQALADVGVTGEERSQKVATIATALSDLYIRTPDQLTEALDLPEVRAQATPHLRGMLLPVVRARLAQRAQARATWMRLVEEAKPPKSQQQGPRPLNAPLCRTLEVARVDVTHIAEIDQIAQCFYARVYLILRITGGADDPDLTSEFEGFPFDKEGRPTFRPSAIWYLNQLDFPNGKSLKVIESKVTTEGNDLQLIKRVEGIFFERFELQNFPFDEQDLTVTVSCNCAMEGPVPVEFCLRASPPPQLGVDTINFTHSDVWNLSPTMLATRATVGASKTRRFPAVHLSANVRRRSRFVLLNAALPVSIISFLSLMIFFVSPEDVSDRLELGMTLLLTAVAFKYTTSTYLPQISYMTLVDKFSMLCTLVIVVGCLAHTVLGCLAGWVRIPYDALEVISRVFFGLLFAAWIGAQLWFARMERSVRNHVSFNRQIVERESGRRFSRKLSMN